jgi:hypothetical protein
MTRLRGCERGQVAVRAFHAAGRMSSGGGMVTADDIEHATGLELLELEQKVKGGDMFKDSDAVWLNAVRPAYTPSRPRPPSFPLDVARGGLQWSRRALCRSPAARPLASRNVVRTRGVPSARVAPRCWLLSGGGGLAAGTQPAGTLDNPVVVTSVATERIVGAVDPDDDSIVCWGIVKVGAPPKLIGDEYFVLKQIEDAH